VAVLVSWERRPGGRVEDEDTFVEIELGHAKREAPRPVRSRPGSLRVESVSYRRAGQLILDRVDLDVSAGDSLAVVGPSGSGKSSLLALLAGLERPDSGRVHRPGGADLRTGVVLQGYGLVSVLTGAENVEVPLQAGLAGALAPDEVRAAAAAALEAVGLSDVADHLVEELSGGQQQRVAVARALVIEPDVLLADEPTAELDHDMKQRVVDLLLAVAGRGGIAVIATHDPEIADRCSRRLRLADGRIVP
jgi:putative ABC transport system ATP-binding protein